VVEVTPKVMIIFIHRNIAYMAAAVK